MVLKMSRNDRAKLFLGRMNRLFGDTLSFPDLNYISNRHKVSVRCNIHNITYAAWPTNLSSGRRGCPDCGPKLTLRDFIEKARKVHGNKYNYDKVEFVNTTTKVIVTCPHHGDWSVKPVAHYHVGSGCPGCALDKNHLNTVTFINRARQVHGDHYDYSKATVNKNTDIVKIVCPIHGEFEQAARSHLAGYKCRQCTVENSRSSLTEFIKKAKHVHGNIYDYSQAVYINSKTKLTVICNHHGPFKIIPNSHITSKTGCPRCRESYGERLIAKYLSELNIVFKKEYSFKGSKYRFDFYLPNHNVLIEFHGIQHYIPVEKFGGVDGHFATVTRDFAKLILAKKKNIPLLVFSYEDLLNDKLIDNLKEELSKLNIVS